MVMPPLPATQLCNSGCNQLIRQMKPITDRQFEIEFLDPDVEAFAFTFG
jgi:hypothetical protein